VSYVLPRRLNGARSQGLGTPLLGASLLYGMYKSISGAKLGSPDGGVNMVDTTVKKIDGKHSPKGEMGQKYLAGGKRISMRLWEKEEPGDKASSVRDYETVGYVLSGKAELVVEGQTVKLSTGDSWVVPANATHSYKILETFTAVEATSPPSEVHNRDSA
jgi:quercetin dioxygenase-like cupin family protein